jgi:uncharacterized membrane protein YdbT with pleckstrin-like domain
MNTTDKKQLDHKYIYQLMLSYIILGFFTWLLFILPVGLIITPENIVLGLLTLFFLPVLYVIAVFIGALLWAKNYSYQLTDDVFVKNYGIIMLRNTSIPYDRIQNINIRRPLSSRIFGLSMLEIQTAGNSGVVLAEGRLPGIDKHEAEVLRDSLLKLAKQSNQKSHGQTHNTGL